MKNKKEVSLVFLILSLAIVFVYWQLPDTFFQQDEWQAFGAAIYFRSLVQGSLIKMILPAASSLSHFTPLASWFWQFEYWFFGLNFTLYAWLAMMLHLVNSFLVYHLAKKLTKNSFLALAASLIFGLSSYAHQAVSWVAVSSSLLPATLFLLLALLFFDRSWRLVLLFISFSLLFKETAIFLFLFLPFWWWLSKRKLEFFRLLKAFLPLVALGLVYFGLRGLLIINQVSSPQPEIVDITPPPPAAFIFRVFSLPLKALTQSFFPAAWLISFSEKMILLGYPQFIAVDGIPNPFIAQSIGFDLVSYILAFLVLLLIILTGNYLKKSGRYLTRALTWGTGLIIIGSLPFGLIPGRAGYFSIFEPRNLYLLGIGSSLVLTLAIFSLASKLAKTKFKKRIIFFSLVFPILMGHCVLIRADLRNLDETSSLRKSFLTSIRKSYPDLPNKVVFFTASDRSYYGLPIEEKILPVQSGFGRMVMVWYQATENFPGCLYEEQFLAPLISQGYRECRERGFGYFRNFDLLKISVKENGIPLESVIGYSWNGEIEKFEDISRQIKTQLNAEIN